MDFPRGKFERDLLNGEKWSGLWTLIREEIQVRKLNNSMQSQINFQETLIQSPNDLIVFNRERKTESDVGNTKMLVAYTYVWFRYNNWKSFAAVSQ